MKKVFVVLSDKNYLEHFKSLYYSAITIGKWDGDFVVIVPESDKGEFDENEFKGVKFFYRIRSSVSYILLHFYERMYFSSSI